MAAERSANFYRAFFEYSMDAVLLTCPDGAIQAANPAACRMFGRTEEEICAAGRYGLVDAASPRLSAMLEERMRTGKTRGELTFFRADGTRFPGEASSMIFKDEDGSMKTVMIIRDLTDLKLIEAAKENLLFEARKNAAEIEAILAAQDDVILVYDARMNVVLSNPAFVRNYGFDPVGVNVSEMIVRVSCRYLDGRALVLSEQPTPRALRGEKVPPIPYRVRRANGEEAVVESASRPLLVNGEIAGSVTIWHDITGLMRAEEELKRSSREIEDLYNHAPCGYHSLDAEGVIVRINDTELQWLGYTRGEVVGSMNWSDLISPESREVFRENFPKFQAQGHIEDLEFEVVRKDGSTFTALLSATVLYDENGDYVMSRSTLFDISERKAMELNIARMANYDTLTELPNRALLFDRLQLALAASRRSMAKMGLIYLDLDLFKPVNDTLGHDVGDLLLKEAARRMRVSVRESDTVGRIGGDEFIVLLPAIEMVGDVMMLAEKIRMALNKPFLLAGRTLNISSSLGVVIYPEHGHSENELVKNADLAMYASKQGGGNRVSLYSPSMPEMKGEPLKSGS